MRTHDENIYRVKIHPNTNTISVIHIGMNCIDPMPDGEYTWETIPERIRERIAVLYMLQVPPPPVVVADVGQRISETVFWVYD